MPAYTGTLFGIDKMIVFMFGFIELAVMFLRINSKAKIFKLCKENNIYIFLELREIVLIHY